MNVLVLGSGGRKHSLCYNLIKSKKISNLWCMPGNAGINRIAKFSNLNTDNNQSILDFCIKKKIRISKERRRLFFSWKIITMVGNWCFINCSKHICRANHWYVWTRLCCWYGNCCLGTHCRYCSYCNGEIFSTSFFREENLYDATISRTKI